MDTKEQTVTSRRDTLREWLRQVKAKELWRLDGPGDGVGASVIYMYMVGTTTMLVQFWTDSGSSEVYLPPTASPMDTDTFIAAAQRIEELTSGSVGDTHGHVVDLLTGVKVSG